MHFYLMEKTPVGYADRMLTGQRYGTQAEAEAMRAERYPDGKGPAGYPVEVERGT